MLTGSIERKEKQKVRELGAKAIVDKPCNFRELVLTVGLALDV